MTLNDTMAGNARSYPGDRHKTMVGGAHPTWLAADLGQGGQNGTVRGGIRLI